MRRILVDAARNRASEKRGGHVEENRHCLALDLEEVADLSSKRGKELIAVDDALNALAHIDSRKARVVELRFFGGLSVTETADILGVSPQTAMRDWRLARAWLMREIGG